VEGSGITCIYYLVMLILNLMLGAPTLRSLGNSLENSINASKVLSFIFHLGIDIPAPILCCLAPSRDRFSNE
jgi:hypothetical protein